MGTFSLALTYILVKYFLNPLCAVLGNYSVFNTGDPLRHQSIMGPWRRLVEV